MICVKSLQLDLNRALLLMVGLWPYKQSKFARVQLIVFYIILISSIIFQFTTFITAECNSQMVIEILSNAFFFITLAIKYNMFNFNMDTVKYLLEVLQYTYNELRDDGEIAIIKKYGTIAKRYTYALTILSVFGIFSVMLLPFWPRFLDNVFSMNESRSHVSLYIVTEYFVNQEKYFYLILLHVNSAFCIGWIALLAVGTMTIACWQYACGMFQIASYRMEQAMMDDALKINDTYNIGLKRIICGIDMHRKALAFVKYFLSKIEVSYFFLMTGVVITLSLNLYRVFDGLSSGVDIEKLISPAVFLATNYVLMFLSNYTAQQVKDHNDLLFITAYNIQWYVTPLYIQRIILFLLQKGIKSFNMNLVGLMVGSLEGFSTLASASISYFAVIYSVRQ
ncbi:uncharacterized protein LOC105183318 [Harpegnathos saltator]|uniref:uncharacterized protein LOC105183318 n=1 Tax=Harpegnathos saltator TaxID=610380 RepID=UPI000DBED430|nr:uncharacterized protein LOC105183318 [Harpegnathos saltator]